MLTNNTKGKEYTWEELRNLWEQTFPQTDIVFSMYDLKEDGETVVPEVNFLDENPIVKGSFKLSFNTWKYGDSTYNIEGRSLTWKTLIDILDEHNDGHHIFLEQIDIKNNNEVFVFLGS